MYAETFNVRPWLETPAKWLRWAMQSLTARNLTDTQYNLQQFWTSLTPAKAQAKTAQDWSEVLTLDAQSQWTLGNLYQAQASDVLKKVNAYTAATGGGLFQNPVEFLTDKLGITTPQLTQYRQEIQDDTNKAAIAFKAQVQLADQAKAAAASAGVASQAAATLTVGKNAAASAPNDAASMTQQFTTMAQRSSMSDLLGLLNTSILGLPAWAWIAGGAALLLLITTAPAAAEASAIRRAVED